jgi:hypothetical protein
VVGVVTAAVVCWSLLGVSPARAGEFEEYRERAAEARYTGRQVVASILDGETEVELFTVEREAGSLLLATDAGYVVSGKGKVRDGGTGVEITAWNEPSAAGRYRASDPIAVTRLGRPCDLFEIHEGETLRARVTFDVVTAAPVSFEVYDGSGRLFRLSAMLDLSSDMPPAMAMLDQAGSAYDVLERVDPGVLPDATGGYTLADAYAGPDDTVHAFYTDGLFSFSVFEVEGHSGADVLGDAERVRIGGVEYQRRVAPGALWIGWNADGRSYILVGDLPPDHLERVLPGLPASRQRGFLSRVWHAVFG